MRLVTLAVTYLTITLLTMAACPASANEAFIAQLTSKAAATEPSSANSTKTMQSAAMLALPVQPKAINSSVSNAANAATNTSWVIKIGTKTIGGVSRPGGET